MPPSVPHGKCVFSLFKVIAFFVFVVSCDEASSSLEQGNTLGKPPSKLRILKSCHVVGL